MKKIITMVLMMSFTLYAIQPLIRDNNRSIVTDPNTGLQWQDDLITSTQVVFDWNSSIKYCEDLNISGIDDWRLPNYNELLSIYDFTTTTAPYIKSGFNNIGRNYAYYTSTTYVSDKPGENLIPGSYIWVVPFDGATLFPYRDQKSIGSGSTKYVRCVRSTNPPN